MADKREKKRLRKKILEEYGQSNFGLFNYNQNLKRFSESIIVDGNLLGCKCKSIWKMT